MTTMNKKMCLAAFVLGLLTLAWVAAGYLGNNPLAHVDPSGFQSNEPPGGWQENIWYPYPPSPGGRAWWCTGECTSDPAPAKGPAQDNKQAGSAVKAQPTPNDTGTVGSSSGQVAQPVVTTCPTWPVVNGWEGLANVDARPMISAFNQGADRALAALPRQYAVIAITSRTPFPLIAFAIGFGLFNPDSAFAPTFNTVPTDRPTTLDRVLEVGVPVALGALGTAFEGKGGPAEVAPELPPYGTLGPKTSGVLRTTSGDTPLISGYKGPSATLQGSTPGMNYRIKAHVEAHAAAIMRNGGPQEGTLFINRVPCPGPTGCASMLPRMLPQGAQLRVLGPDGYDQTFRGLPDP